MLTDISNVACSFSSVVEPYPLDVYEDSNRDTNFPKSGPDFFSSPVSSCITSLVFCGLPGFLVLLKLPGLVNSCLATPTGLPLFSLMLLMLSNSH